MKTFRQILTERQKRVDSLVCLGLDPLPKKCPSYFKNHPQKYTWWMFEIAAACAPYVSMFKIQSAHWEALEAGKYALRLLINSLHSHFPDIPVFLDSKRGDIGRTQSRYKVAHFEIDGADGMNFNPYMGQDCLSSLVEKPKQKAIAGLCRTSNPSAWEVQDIVISDGQRFWEYMAECILNWAEETCDYPENIGLVLGAAHSGKLLAEHYQKMKIKGKEKLFSYWPSDFEGVYSEHISRCRQITGNKLWYLIPGIGTQKGFIQETIKAGFAGAGSMVINSSSAIIFASSKDDFAQAAARQAKKLRDEIRCAGGKC